MSSSSAWSALRRAAFLTFLFPPFVPVALGPLRMDELLMSALLKLRSASASAEDEVLELSPNMLVPLATSTLRGVLSLGS